MADKKEKVRHVDIYGVTVNLNSDELKKIKSREDLQKLNLFSGLSKNDAEGAEIELLGKLGVPALGSFTKNLDTTEKSEAQTMTTGNTAKAGAAPAEPLPGGGATAAQAATLEKK